MYSNLSSIMESIEEDVKSRIDKGYTKKDVIEAMRANYIALGGKFLANALTVEDIQRETANGIMLLWCIKNNK